MVGVLRLLGAHRFNDAQGARSVPPAAGWLRRFITVGRRGGRRLRADNLAMLADPAAHFEALGLEVVVADVQLFFLFVQLVLADTLEGVVDERLRHMAMGHLKKEKKKNK